jgi:catechol 2,3-dioxygenase-like lactoylglutathione lyase family enzyme
MLNIESVNHIGIRIKDRTRSVSFYELLGFEFDTDAGFDDGHPIIMKHPSGVVLNLLGPANTPGDSNVLMDIDEKHTGITHVALTVSSLNHAKNFMSENDLESTGSFSFENMSAVFLRDPDRNVIELDAYDSGDQSDASGYSDHP